ncbi:hypothetical protein ARAM_004283 [Aspergillus rambellii]|uniref:Uncharacterized protein n=1 Tax=Aspergillus rambellii TaxID=308745 RepID=A0A0F8U7P1_9EURO|nr:hypothetical protein ARAM_004283 [Aspergillus rambellii]
MTPAVAIKSSGLGASVAVRASEQWKITLQDIKLLYLQRQYKRCIARSSAILNTSREAIHPVYKTYLYYYSAISYEAMGRYAHNYSINKLPLLHSALDCFVTCLAVLPNTIRIHETDPETPSYTSFGESCSASDLSGTLSPTESLVSSITDIIDKTLGCSDDDDDDDDDANSTSSSIYQGSVEELEEKSLMPPPLHVRKSPAQVNNVSASPFQNADDADHYSAEQAAPSTDHTGSSGPGRVRPPPPLPIKVVPFGRTCPDRSKSRLGGGDIAVVVVVDSSHAAESHGYQQAASAAAAAAPMTPRRREEAAAVGNYNASIHFLYSQINSNIASVHYLIDEVAGIRQARKKKSQSFGRSASFWSFRPVTEGASPESVAQRVSDPDSTKETMQARIARLRAEGWQTVGLRSSKRRWKGSAYYKAYCGSVLDELYLDAQMPRLDD